MKKIFMITALVLTSHQAMAIPFEPTFSDYSFAGSQYTVDAVANNFFATNYGIEIDNAYLYVDSRDTFDGIGIANGTVDAIGTSQTGRITFLDTTDFVSVDYVTISSANYNSYDTDGNVLDSFSTGSGNVNDTYLFDSGSLIGFITWEATGGYAAVSGLRYNYDGTTDGKNDDLNGDGNNNQIPEPTILALLAMGLVGFGLTCKNKGRTS